MGRIKQLLPLVDGPAIHYCIKGINSSGIRDIVLVLGPDSPELLDAINGFPVRVAVNNSRQSEMAESVRVGLRCISPSATGIMICLSDQPLIEQETFASLASLHGECPDKIIIPVYKGKKGHPTLFPASIIKEIFSGLTLRHLIDRNPGTVYLQDVRDEGVVLDMDTIEDYRIILEKINSR